MKNIYQKQVDKLEKKEHRLMTKRNIKIIDDKVNSLKEHLDLKIPPKLRETLNSAFDMGFRLVFEKGTKYIEKTYDKNKIQLEHDINNYTLNRNTTSKTIRAMDMQSLKSSVFNSTVSIIEGAGLGLLGIGLPDIPLLISVILKNIYEISLSYGFNYQYKNEQFYILNLICLAVCEEADKAKYNKRSAEYEHIIASNILIEDDFNKIIADASEQLSNSMLFSKFIQGFPIVGAVGSIANFSIVNKISKFARIKYKKRYMQQKII